MKITSRKNERVQHLRRLGADGAYRRECGEMVCDGFKLLEEAISAGLEIREVLTAGDISGFALPSGAAVYETERDIIEAVSQQKTPQNVVFSAKIPRFERAATLAGSIILENIQDPGNVGTVIRTANAFDVPQVILAGDCADPFSPKTLRAAMGAAFRKRVVRMTLEEIAGAKGKVPLYAAALSDKAADLRGVSLADAAVAVGNEGRGLTREAVDICDGTVIIPMTAFCESLNASVAASIIMWEMARSRL